jgi:penicillin-binding protein 1A
MKLRRTVIYLALLAICGFPMLFSGVYLYLSPSLPSVEVLKDIRLQTPMRVYTREGDLIGQFGEKKRNPLPYSRIPPQFVKALLAAEDDGFFNHAGIDIMGLLRAVSELVLTGEKGSGGSTLTMQVARNYFLTLERTFTRKFKEILLSLEIERTLSKEEIFELYFNQPFLGHRAYGFEAAAQVYYGSHIGDLDTAQLAMLAGLPKAPSRYNPLSNPGRALIRRDWILGRMRSLDYITDSEYQTALQAPVTATHHGAKLAFHAPYAAEMARSEMLQRYGLAAYSDGYHVFTTISSELQQTANRSVLEGLTTYDERHGYRGPEQKIPADPEQDMTATWLATLEQTPVIVELLPAIVVGVGELDVQILLPDGSEAALDWENGLRQARPYITEDRRGPNPTSAGELLAIGDLIRVRTDAAGGLHLSQVPAAQAALVALAPDNGAILSIVGGLGFGKSKFNRVTQATRQPGSNFKPFIYAAALENGFTAASIINDAPVVFEDAALEDTWRPENDGGKFYGPTRLRWALTKSRNLVSIRLLQALGIRTAIDYVARFGFDPDALAADLSLALGTQVITPLQLATAYASLANGGYRVYPYLVERVENYGRENIFQATPATVCRECENPVETASLDDLDEELSMEDILSETGPPQMPAAERIMDARVAFIINSILQDVITRGTGRRARALDRSDIAGKTGTTNGPTDAWFSGYSPDVVATTWVGFDQNLPLGKREFGGSAALPIWIDFMRVALAGSPERALPIPEGIVNVKIDPGTGLLAKPGQTDAIFEFFRVEQVPGENQVSPNAR